MLAGPATSPRSTRSSIAARTSAMAVSRREASRSTFSAIRLRTTMRGSCSTTCPRPTPSASATPHWLSARREALTVPGDRACSSPEAIISASTMAVVWSASISSSE